MTLPVLKKTKHAETQQGRGVKDLLGADTDA